MLGGVKGTRALNLLPHSFRWTADLDIAEASSATASTEMVTTTLGTFNRAPELLRGKSTARETRRGYT